MAIDSYRTNFVKKFKKCNGTCVFCRLKGTKYCETCEEVFFSENAKASSCNKKVVSRAESRYYFALR